MSIIVLRGFSNSGKDYIGQILCDKYNYKSVNELNYKTHTLNNHSTKQDRKVNFKFYCEKFDFGCFTESCYNIHNLTQKHNMKTLK